MILVGQRSVFYWYDHLAACVCVCVHLQWGSVQFSSAAQSCPIP